MGTKEDRLRHKVKVLYVDIECTPVLGYAYDKYEATIIGVKEESYMLSFSFKWEGGKIKAYSLTDFPSFNKNPRYDGDLVKMLWHLFDEADIIIAHNGDRFDIKKSNTYFIKHGLTPPSPYKTVDTLKVARRYFSFFGNSLDDLARFFKLDGKIETEKGLWKRCIEGDRRAFKTLVAYNKHDVVLLVQIYKILLPWVQNHPHVSPENGHLACQTCGSTNTHKRGIMRLIGAIRHRYQCQSCGHWFLGPLQKDK